MKNHHISLRLCFAFFLAGTSLSSQAQLDLKQTNYGIQLGSMGLGIQAANQVTEKLQLRVPLTFAQMTFKKDVRFGDIASSNERKMRTGGIGVISDWSLLPSYETIRFSGGLFFQFNRLKETRSYAFYNEGLVEDMGSLTIDVKSFPLSPYIGVLLGKINPDKQWNILLDVGTLFHGRPKVDFTGTGRIAPTADQDDVVENNLKNYNFYPNINFQLYYNFK